MISTHGTNGGYARGCRCVPCSDAMRAYRRSRGTCTVESCDRLVFALGMCRGHWTRSRTEEGVRANEPLRYSEPKVLAPKKSPGVAAAVYNNNGSTCSQTLTLEEWRRIRAEAPVVHVVVAGLAS